MAEFFQLSTAERLDALNAAADTSGLLPQNARKALSSSMDDRKSMSKLERQLALGEAVINFTHPAHHVGNDGDPEIFSRLDAALAVASTASLVSSFAEKFQ